MRVRMYPHTSELSTDSSGIAQVVINYFRHLPKYGIELVEPSATSYDLDVSHAAGHVGAMVHHSHGLLWTAQREYSQRGYQINADLVETIKLAREVTVPSKWVAQTFERDMRFSPHIVPHGVNWDEWQNGLKNEGYVLWGKNRTSDGLDPSALNLIAGAFPNVEFVTTFSAGHAPKNVKVLGHSIPHEQMKTIVQSAAVLLATDKETWGIQHIEAMAAGVPVLSVDLGAVPEFMPHGVAGYCFQPGNAQDAVDGLAYCLQYRDQLGANGRELAKEFTWEKACEQVAGIYQDALVASDPTVSIVIPCYNYGKFLDNAIRSAVTQSYGMVEDVIVIDDGSTDDSVEIATMWSKRDDRVTCITQKNEGVASARNRGLSYLTSKYVVFLDADDQIEPGFVENLVPYLEQDPRLCCAYTGVKVPLKDGTVIMPWDWQYRLEQGQILSQHLWPHKFDYQQQMERTNQIPTCCLLRRKALVRVGGYRDRYCPLGAGSEDAELFLRLGKYGWGSLYVGPVAHALYVHTVTAGIGSGRYGDYEEPDWTAWHPETKDGKHLFASIAKPENNISHPIHAYDVPMVSVIIPVGPGHEKRVIDALDSLDAQTFRGWEAVVVWDSKKAPSQYLRDTYPHVKWVGLMPGGNGTGIARNLGVSHASAPLIAFLDADDYYHADFLKKSINALMQQNAIVYTDYISIVPKELGNQPGMEYVRDIEDGKVLLTGRFDDYSQALAMQRPSGDRPYIWSGVTMVLPKAWHEAIEGFDEEMHTWEDCDYLLRLAWAGYDFVRIPEQLWIYDFTSGGRRHYSHGKEQELIGYMQDKYDRMVDSKEEIYQQPVMA